LVTESEARESASMKILRGFRQEGKNIAAEILARHGVQL
jgi:hypothetical protein